MTFLEAICVLFGLLLGLGAGVLITLSIIGDPTKPSKRDPDWMRDWSDQ